MVVREQIAEGWIHIFLLFLHHAVKLSSLLMHFFLIGLSATYRSVHFNLLIAFWQLLVGNGGDCSEQITALISFNYC